MSMASIMNANNDMKKKIKFNRALLNYIDSINNVLEESLKRTSELCDIDFFFDRVVGKDDNK